MTDVKLLLWRCNTWNHLIVGKQMIKNVFYKMCFQIIHI